MKMFYSSKTIIEKDETTRSKDIMGGLNRTKVE